MVSIIAPCIGWTCLRLTVHASISQRAPALRISSDHWIYVSLVSQLWLPRTGVGAASARLRRESSLVAADATDTAAVAINRGTCFRSARLIEA